MCFRNVFSFFQPASNIIVSQKPLTPKPSKSPLQGWVEDSQGKRQPTDAELISTKQDTSLHAEDQVDGLEVQSVGGNNVRENTEGSKDGLENSKNAENDTKVNGEVIENGKTERNGENVNDVTDDVENRTGNQIFVTEGSGLGEESVQKQENAENISSENKESEQLNGVMEKS